MTRSAFSETSSPFVGTSSVSSETTSVNSETTPIFSETTSGPASTISALLFATRELPKIRGTPPALSRARINPAMDASYTNKQTAFQTTVAFADKPEHRPIWKDQDPKVFTVKIGKARTLVADLVKFTKDLDSDLSGVRQDKETVQKELATAIILLGNACGEWFGDHGDATNQTKVLFTPSGLLGTRDQVPANAAGVVVEKARAILAGPAPAAPAHGPADYGITAPAANALEELLADYNAVLTGPTGARKARKGQREQLPDRFAEVDAELESCDRLVVQLRGKSNDLPAVRAGKDAFVDGWFASRRIDDLGNGRSANGTPPPTPPPVPPAK